MPNIGGSNPNPDGKRSARLPPVDAEAVRLAADGVVLIRRAFSADWIEIVRSGVEQNVNQPSERGRFWDRDPARGSCFYDSQVWQRIPEYRDFIEHSPMAALAGRLMAVDAVNFFFDAVFVRSKGNQFRTPFHQDEPFWSVEGFDTCSAWMPLVPVEKRSCLEFVRSSHLWPEKFAQTNFGALTGDDRDQVRFDRAATVPFPDIEGRRDEFEILSWDMEPGDVAVFNGRTIHGGSGLLGPDRDLMVFNTQWLGDDVRVNFRSEGMDPDHSAVMKERGLRPGDRVGTDLYPELWRRAS